MNDIRIDKCYSLTHAIFHWYYDDEPNRARHDETKKNL